MSTFLFIAFVFLGIFSGATFVGANGAIHEGVAAILLLSSIACLIGSGILTRLEKIQKAIERADENNWKINHAAWRELRAPGN